MTGTAGLTSELDSKRLEVLRELKPTGKVFGVLANPKRPGLEGQLQELQSNADKMKVTLEVRKAITGDEIDTAFQAFAQNRVDGVIVTADPFFNSRRSQVVGLASSLAIPSIYQWREFVSAGGLVSYGPSITDAYRQAGISAGRILKGDKPADLPVMLPTKFELVINLRTAKTLGLTVPATLLARADDAID